MVFDAILGNCKRCLDIPCPVVSVDEDGDDSLFVCDQGGETKTLCEFEMLRCIYRAKFGYNITEAYVSVLHRMFSFEARKG